MLLISFPGMHALKRDWLETGFLALLPATEQQPEVAKAIQQHNELINRKVIWLTGAASPKQAIAYAEELKRELQQSGLFNTILLQLPQQQYSKNYQQLFPYRYQLLDEQTLKTLRANPEDLIKQSLEMLYSPIGQMQAAALERDPLLLFGRYFNSQNPLRLNLEQGVVIVQEQNRVWALLISELEDKNLKLDKLESLQALVSRARQRLQAQGGAVMATGMPLFTAQGSHSAKQEISIVGTGSMVGVILLLLLTFRSPRPLLLSFLTLGCGVFTALIISILYFGRIHILTLVFGASLIGVAVDYALHYFCSSFSSNDWTARRGLHFILPGITIDLLTSLISYACLGFSPFPGLQEMAFFSAIGLISVWLTVILLYPLMLTGFKPAHKPVMLKLTTYWQQHWPLWLIKNRIWLALISLVLIVGGLWQLTPRDDVRLLQSAPEELMQTDLKIRQLLSVTGDSQFFLVSGKNEQEWHQNEQALLHSLAALKQQQVLKSYDGLSQYWPEPNTQREHYQLLKHALYGSGLLPQYMRELGFSEAAIANEKQQFTAAENRSISLPAWLESADEARKLLWLGCASNQCQSTVSLSGIKDLPALAQLQTLPRVRWVDQAGQLSALFGRYRVSAGMLLIVSYSSVLIGLGLKFGWRHACTIISVPVFATVAALAMLGWFDQLFSLFNLFALLLVLGIGVDYAIFFYIAKDKRASTSLAVTLSALTTLLSFGLLATSSTEIVHAFGVTVAVGILTALLLAPLVGEVGGSRVLKLEKAQA